MDLAYDSCLGLYKKIILDNFGKIWYTIYSKGKVRNMKHTQFYIKMWRKYRRGEISKEVWNRVCMNELTNLMEENQQTLKNLKEGNEE